MAQMFVPMAIGSMAMQGLGGLTGAAGNQAAAQAAQQAAVGQQFAAQAQGAAAEGNLYAAQGADIAATAQDIAAEGTIAGGNWQKLSADMTQGEAYSVATQLEENAGSEVGVAQRQAFLDRYNTNEAISSARARTAGGGFSLTGTSPMGNVSGLAGRGEYQALADLWTGTNKAVGDINQAAFTRYGGDIAEMGGKASQVAALYGATGQRYAAAGDTAAAGGARAAAKGALLTGQGNLAAAQGDLATAAGYKSAATGSILGGVGSMFGTAGNLFYPNYFGAGGMRFG